MKYFELLRVKHYIKNLLVFLPLFFGCVLTDINLLAKTSLGFVAFCLVSSSIYIFNDIRDVEWDRKHPRKKNRPIASGSITIKQAFVIIAVCLILATVVSVCIGSSYACLLLLLYLVINIAYSLGMKNVPIVDVAILASGFVIRVFFGGFIVDVTISKWLYLVVVSGSLFMGLGKRLNEYKMKNDTRGVLKFYSVPFLEKYMYVCVAMANVFYALWSMDMANNNIMWFVPMFIIITMYYCMILEKDNEGDPVEIVTGNKPMIVLVVLYAVSVFCLLYFV